MANIRQSRKSGFILRSGVRRRETLWIDLPLTQTTMTAAGGTIIYSLSTAAKAFRPYTVIRTHVSMLVQSDQEAAGENYQAAYGECIVSDQASAIGVTAVPTPLTDLSSDLWFAWKSLMGLQLVTPSSGGITGVFAAGELDSRAMRKVEEGQDSLGVAEAGLLGVVLTTVGRQLLKMH